MPSLSTTPRRQALDGLRGWAVLTVVFYHSVLYADPGLVARVLHRPVQDLTAPRDVATKLTLAVLNGEVAVQAFFVMSGLVLFRSLHDLAAAGPAGAAWRFTLRRVLRLYPALIVCLLFTAALQPALATLGWPAAPVDPVALVRNILLLDWAVNGATWTLHAEVAAIPLLLGCFFAAQRYGLPALAVALAAAVSAIPLRSALGLSDAVVAAFPFLVLGAALSRGGAWMRASITLPAALVALLAVNSLLPHGTPLRLALQIGAVSVLVGWVYVAGENRAGMLRHPLSQWLGRVSFGVYLWNVPIFEAMLRAADPSLRSERPLELGLLVGMTAAALALPLASMSERWVERPFIHLGRRLTRPRASTTV